MTTPADVRRLALALAGTTEQPHHGFPSFRAGRRIYASLPDPGHLHVMLDPDAIRDAVAVDPVGCEEKWWGETLAAVRVTLDRVEVEVVEQLLREAWTRAVG